MQADIGQGTENFVVSTVGRHQMMNGHNFVGVGIFGSVRHILGGHVTINIQSGDNHH